MLPPSPVAESALSVPGTLMIFLTALARLDADRTMRPPGAVMLPETSISAPAVCGLDVGTATCMKPSPLRSSVICSPEPRPIFPYGTEIEPLFATWPPKRAT